MAIIQLMSHDQNILIDWVDVADVLHTFYNVTLYLSYSFTNVSSDIFLNLPELT